jgi:DNA-binding cell septation regulator SpoVG
MAESKTEAGNVIEVKLSTKVGKAPKIIKARGSFTVSKKIRINCTVMEGSKGLFVGLPGRKGKDKDGNDKWYGDVYIADKALQERINTAVIAEYKKIATTGDTSTPDDSSTPSQDDYPF